MMMSHVVSLCFSAQYFPCTVREVEHLIIMCLLYIVPCYYKYYDGLGYLEAYYLDNDFFCTSVPNFELHGVLYY
jgi:hypothetical protein